MIGLAKPIEKNGLDDADYSDIIHGNKHHPRKKRNVQ